MTSALTSENKTFHNHTSDRQFINVTSLQLTENKQPVTF